MVFDSHAWRTTWGKTPAETIGSDFEGMVDGALKGDSVVSAVELVRMSVFSEARFQWQRLTNGRPSDLFGTPELAILERPWMGGTTGDLLARMLLDADFAGSAYHVEIDGHRYSAPHPLVGQKLEARMTGLCCCGSKSESS